VNELLVSLVGALLATNQPLAVSNLIQEHAGVSVPLVNPNDPEEKALTALMVRDDNVLDEVDQWIRDNNAFAAHGAGEPREVLNKRIRARLDSVRKDYEEFLRQFPNSARGHLAYGTFLNDIGEEDAAMAQYETTARLDPKNPAAWNQIANYCGEHGPLTNAFASYARAIELDPTEPLYYRNLATTVYLFRKDAMAYYHISEPEVFDKALALYRKAMQQAPQDFVLAADYAETYYGIRPLRTNDALAAWTNVLQAARDDIQRQSVYLHLARVKTYVGRFAEARAHLNDATNPAFADMKRRLEKSLADHENRATNTAAATGPADAPAKPANAPNSGP
jgi:tetratricopeptide (TPR) repeat protein